MFDSLLSLPLIPAVPGHRIRRGLLIACFLTGLWQAVSVSHSQAADRGAVKKSIAAAANYLRSIQGGLRGGRDSLCTYAILKADGKATEAGNAAVIAGILERCQGETYQPSTAHEGVYSSGIEAMILSDIDPEKYKPQIQKIADYLVSQQLEIGAFDYRAPSTSVGDTSVTQYGTLGLWAAARAGVDIPTEVWDKLAMWHLRVQEGDGGFAYTPGKKEGITGIETNGSMTGAAAASLTICAMYLYPHRMQETSGLTDGLIPKEAPAETGDPNDPLGVLTVRGREEADRPAAPAGPYKPQVSFNQIQAAVQKAIGYVAAHYNVLYYRDSWRHYHYYTIERMGSLTDVDRLGSHDWFDEFSDELLRTQQANGSWDMPGMEVGDNHCVATSLAVLFLTRSTAKLLNRVPPADPIGGGIQAGGRGLPDDLASVTMQNGRVAQTESTGPLDDLLKSLESGASDDLFNLQKQIVKKIQLGDRSELIGQTDRLVQLLDNPSPEIRRTALWALARSDDLTKARYLVAALEDPDSDVLMEAHNALCWMSRRPNAFDIPASPLEGLAPDATDEQKQAAVEKWRANALQKWGTWYLRMSTYEEKNTPFAHDLAKKIGLR